MPGPIAGVPELHLSFFGSRPSLFLGELAADVDDSWSGDEDDNQCNFPLLEGTRLAGRIPPPLAVRNLHCGIPETLDGEDILDPQVRHLRNPTQSPILPHGATSRLNSSCQRGISVYYSGLSFS